MLEAVARRIGSAKVKETARGGIHTSAKIETSDATVARFVVNRSGENENTRILKEWEVGPLLPA